MPFVKGQKSFSTKGMKFYHKGDETKMFPEGQQPEGWVKGLSKRSKIESYKKRKVTNLKKYGVENISKSDYAKEKKKETTLRHFGVENPFQSKEVKEKIKKINLEKYGVEHPFQSEEVQEKVKKTNLEKYGVEYSLQSKEVREKAEQTNLTKYGYKSSFSSPEIREKIKRTNLERYGVENPGSLPEIREKVEQTNLTRYGYKDAASSHEIREKIKETNLEKYNTQWFCNTQMCTSSKKNLNHSYSNNSFKDLLDTMKINYVEEFPIDDVKRGTSYRYDFKVGKYLIELDSTAYHNSYKHPFNKPKDKFYHQKKSKFAYSHGFICIHIFDWDNPEEVLSYVLRGSLEISGFVEPRLFLYNSKEDRVIKYSDGLDVSNLLSSGYLPVYDDGAILKNK